MIFGCRLIFIVNGNGIFGLCIALRSNEFVGRYCYYELSLRYTTCWSKSCLLVVRGVFCR